MRAQCDIDANPATVGDRGVKFDEWLIELGRRHYDATLSLLLTCLNLVTGS